MTKAHYFVADFPLILNVQLNAPIKIPGQSDCCHKAAFNMSLYAKVIKMHGHDSPGGPSFFHDKLLHSFNVICMDRAFDYAPCEHGN